MASIIICPECETICSSESTRCHVCGADLRDVTQEEIGFEGTLLLTDEEREQVLPQIRMGRAYFSPQSRVRLYFPNTDNAVEIDIKDSVTIGRSREGSEIAADIDLGPFGATGHGVSRRHAQLKRHHVMLMIGDLGSSNGTMINGQKLSPHDFVVLRDGDELQLGNLKLKVSFVTD